MLFRTLSYALTALVVALLMAGCGGSDDDGAGDTTRDRDRADRTTTAETTDTSGDDSDGGDGVVDQCSTQAQIYLVRGEQLGVAHHMVEYEADECGATESMLEAAMRELLAAPTPRDRAARLLTTIPDGTKLLDLRIKDDLATVDLSDSFQSGGGSLSMTLRVAQVVATLTAISGVELVAFRIDGEPVEAVGGEGMIVDPPRSRTDIERELPTILLEDPAPGDCIADGYAGDPGTLHVGGSANVFEAVLFAELRRGGRVLESTRIEAESGTGTRGAFEAQLPTDEIAGSGPLTLRAYSRSPRDGSPVNVVDVALDPGC